jgi:hypothetical protein
VPSLRGVFVPSNLQFAPLFDFFVVMIWTVGLMALCVNIIRHDIVIKIRKLAEAKNNESNSAETFPNASESHWATAQTADDRDSFPAVVFRTHAQNPVRVEPHESEQETAEHAKLDERIAKYLRRKAG